MLRLISPFLDLLFPRACPACKGAFEFPHSTTSLCPQCLAQLERIESEPHCRMCAMPLPMHGSPCPDCRGKGPPLFYRIVRLGPYTHPLQDLILQLKYHKKWGIGEELADRLLARESVKELLHETQVIIPVPLHWKRRLMRWYNQAEVVARRLSSRCGVPMARPVRRLRNTETQTHLHSHARRVENLKDAFSLTDPSAIAGKHVTVIDDVWTTGATLQSLARVLRPARPASLSAIVLAAADPKGYERVENRDLGPMKEQEPQISTDGHG